VVFLDGGRDWYLFQIGVQCIDFSSTSRLLLCGGAEGVSVWDLKTKALKKSFQVGNVCVFVCVCMHVGHGIEV